MTNYDIDLKCHLGKINVTSDALSRKPIALFLMHQKELLEEIRQLDLEIILLELEVQIMAMQLQPPWVERIKKSQKDNSKLHKFRKHIETRQRTDLSIQVDGSIRSTINFLCQKQKFDRKYFQMLIVHLILFIIMK